MAPLLSSESLKALGNTSLSRACSCALRPCAAWDSFTQERWPTLHMRQIGTLRNPDVYEPTPDEHHPDGTRYALSTAPIAVNFFPCNVSDVYACDSCEKVVLRYTEFGGYYLDHRVRELDSSLVV